MGSSASLGPQGRQWGQGVAVLQHRTADRAVCFQGRLQPTRCRYTHSCSPGPRLAVGAFQAPPVFPGRHRDWQEAGYPQGNPSPRLGDPAAACLFTLQAIRAGSLLWEAGAGFHGNPQLPPRGFKAQEESGQASLRGCDPGAVRKAPVRLGLSPAETGVAPALPKGRLPLQVAPARRATIGRELATGRWPGRYRVPLSPL